MRRTPRLLIVIIFLIALVLGITFAIKYAKGYRPSFSKRTLEGTGLLAANSTPKGATVFINNKLTTATDDTLNLPPGEYQVRIAKDGFIPWEKTIQLEPELVTQTNARLFPSVPDLKPLTFSGVIRPIPSPDGEKIVFSVENATTDTKNGLYVLDLLNRPLSLNASARQISRTSTTYDLVNAELSWAPESNQILATLNSGETNEVNVLLNPNSFNDLANFKDVTAQLPVIKKEWQELIDIKLHEQLKVLPPQVQEIATQSAKLLHFSPDEKKLLYVATASAKLADSLIPPLPASSTQLQTRQLEPNNYYVYDLEEDKNFLLSPFNELIPVHWYPDSNHLILIETNQENQSNRIIITEYDATNRQVVYAGPFADNFTFPWPDGSRLVIMASLNGGSNLPPNLYSINLK